MNRRQFCIRAGELLLVLPVGSLLFGCGNTGGTSQGSGLTVTSSTVNSHTHTFFIPQSDLTSPPSTGYSNDTSSAQSHTHTVSLTQAELQTINGGGSVTKDSSDVGHHHSFTFHT